MSNTQNRDPQQYEQEFGHNFRIADHVNYAGYGPDNKWRPPITTTTNFQTAMWKSSYTLLDPINFDLYFYGFYELALSQLVKFQQWYRGDSQDGAWYNNAFAQGAQIYPHGIHYFYDMYSDDGLQKYYDDLLSGLQWKFLSIFTLLIPIPVWEILVNYPSSGPNQNEDDYWFYFWYFATPAGYFMKIYCFFSADCPLQDGWKVVF